MDTACKVRLEAFEGPLDLLLHLIQKNKLDIKDIPIALVTSQYLEYLDFMKALDVVIAGEYLVMAATLMHIKSRMLLPRPAPDDEDYEDPRLEIVRPLQELMEIRKGAEFLAERPFLEVDVFLPGPDPEFEKMKQEDSTRPLLEVSLHELVSAFKDVLGGSGLPRALEIAKAKVSLSARMEEITNLLHTKKKLSFFELFSPKQDRLYLIVTFMALLELAKLGATKLVQESPGKDIIVLAANGLQTRQNQN